MLKASIVPNICIFSRAFYPAVGGLERIAYILANQSASFGYKVEVVTDTLGLSDEDDRKFPFKITRAHDYQTRVDAFRHADAVLFMNVSLHGLLAAIVARAPIIFSHHGIYRGRGWMGRSLELLKRQLTRLYPNIAVSQFVARNLPAASMVIPNAYDNILFKQPGHPGRTLDFVFCGRLVSDKGADMCIRAFSRVLKSQSNATLTIVGDGPELEALQVLVKNLGISVQVRFAGALTGQRLVDELQQHACLVVPSYVAEGFGIVALEGVACCDTVIVTRRGGLPEAIGDCGLVVGPTDEKMAGAMIAVITARRAGKVLPGQPSDERREKHLARHRPDDVTRQYLAVIEQAISHRTNRGNS